MSAQQKEQLEVKASQSGKTCCVACKLPNGLHLDIRTPGQPARRISVRGSNAGAIVEGRALYPGRVAVAGYGITEQVPEQFFDEWLALNAQLPIVRNGLIFKHKQLASVRDMAIDREDQKTGLEPLDPDLPAAGLEEVQRYVGDMPD